VAVYPSRRSGARLACRRRAAGQQAGADTVRAWLVGTRCLACWRPAHAQTERMAKNVLGGELEPCSFEPLTGFYRDRCCNTGAEDAGAHVVCARVTAEFLEFSKQAGNDLSTPQFGFGGLQPGDHWCLCAARWQEAFEAGMAPDVVLEATHMRALEWINLDDLRRHAVA